MADDIKNVNDAFPTVIFKKGSNVLCLMSRDSEVKEGQYEVLLGNDKVNVVLDIVEAYEDVLEFMNIITMAYRIVGYETEMEV